MVLEREKMRIFVKPNIPALKYDRDMEIEAASTFIEFTKVKYKDIKLSDFGFLLMKHNHVQEQALTKFCCVYIVKRLVILI